MSDNFKNSNDCKRIFLFHETIDDRIISRESSWLEFKESFNWNSKDRYAKSIVAFANNKGGYIVFGIKDQPRDLVGLQSNNFETLDEAKITEYLNTVFSPEIIFEKFIVAINNKNVGIIYTHKSDDKPIICVKNDGELKESDIYYRYNARSEKIKYPELKKIFYLVKENEKKIWMEHFEKISKIGPSNAAILDTIDGKIIGRGGTLVIDKKLIPKLKFINQGSFKETGMPTLRLIGDIKPVSIVASRNNSGNSVKITEDPNAPAIRLEEDDILKKQYPFSYNDLIKVLAKRFKNFKINNKFHKIRKGLMKYKNLSRTRYLDPDNQKSSKKDFYSPNIVDKFDKFYSKK